MSDSSATCVWRGDIDSLAFRPEAHQGFCVIHRRAFCTLLGFEPTPQQCSDFFQQRLPDFIQAAQKKIARASISAQTNFHLTSRDVRRASAAAAKAHSMV